MNVISILFLLAHDGRNAPALNQPLDLAGLDQRPAADFNKRNPPLA